MLEVNSLSRSYGDFLAVDKVSFSIQQGEIVGLLGHNGAGKTTIMKMLSGYLEQDTGRVLFNGLDLASSRKEIQQQIGYLPENLPVYGEMTVADYLDYAAELKGLQGEEKNSEISRVIQDTDIAIKALDPINTLSRGYKQRVGVAQALLGRPRLLILDEPTNGLDPTQTEQMRELIRQIAREATVILSTHIMQEVEALCDRVLIVNAGRLVVDEKLDELRQTTQLELGTDLARDALTRSLESNGQITRIEPDTGKDSGGPWHHYVIHITDGAKADSLCSQVSSTIINQNGRLCRLAPRVRNLETLFREISTGLTASHEEGVRHVA